jgi:pimeloyl-ACP methyl ester carboxylesterase
VNGAEAGTRYAVTTDGLSIAYEVVGDGPFDLVLVPGFVSHLEHMWSEPTMASGLRRLSSFSRLIRFDKRGTGLSDRDLGVATLEQRVDDLRAVMDAVDSRRAALFGVFDGAAVAALFGATHPERTTALVLFGAFPRVLEDDDWPGIPAAVWDQRVDEALSWFDRGPMLQTSAPSVAHDPDVQDWWATDLRLGSSPGAMRALMQMMRDIDLRAVLPSIHAPTLVLHRRGDRVVPLPNGEYIANRIPGAKFVALEGDDHLLYGDTDAVYGEVEEFLTGTRQSPPTDRMLTTIAVTDIVSSTARVAEMGDAAWREALDRHDELVRLAASEHRGRVVKTTGDGVLAIFDGPARAVRFAVTVGDRLRAQGIESRAGVHTGEIEIRGDDIGGIAVHLAFRIASLAGTGEVLTSRTVKDLTAGSGLAFDDCGVHQLKGVPEPWQVYSVTHTPSGPPP